MLHHVELNLARQLTSDQITLDWLKALVAPFQTYNLVDIPDTKSHCPISSRDFASLLSFFQVSRLRENDLNDKLLNQMMPSFYLTQIGPPSVVVGFSVVVGSLVGSSVVVGFSSVVVGFSVVVGS